MTAGRRVNSTSQSWCTPQKYIDALNLFWEKGIDLDPCSNQDSIVGAKTKFELPYNDGLIEEWNFKTIYVNPPYGTDRLRGTSIKNWLCKCAISHHKYGAEIIALIPVATNTSHWKKYIFGNADAICFLYDTRLKFIVDGTTDNKGAPMACCMIYWGDNIARFQNLFMRYGAVLDISKLKGIQIGTPDEQLTIFNPYLEL